MNWLKRFGRTITYKVLSHNYEREREDNNNESSAADSKIRFVNSFFVSAVFTGSVLGQCYVRKM